MERFWLAFIPLFVAFDAPGLLPMFWNLSQGLSSEQRQQAIHKAAVVACLVGPSFLLISEWIFGALGIQLADVMVAGGVVLFVLALNDLLHVEKSKTGLGSELGAVPLAVPLMVGPAVLTTLLLVRKQYGVWLTWATFNLNLLITWAVLLTSETLMKWVGREAAAVISKVAGLVLAAFGVMLIRQGILSLLSR
ncbi:MAG: MarC family protein [Candidatus Omnitrophica bacterium]|nr:MarC family protein [Candidatus Omnitrophota bacterium]